MLQQVTHSSIERAIAALESPLTFGTTQVEANRLLARIHPVVCVRCEADGHTPGIRKRRQCRTCKGRKYGYAFGVTKYWTGWARTTKANEGVKVAC